MDQVGGKIRGELIIANWTVQLTASGTRGGGESVNSYDAISNGNFDDDEPVGKLRH